ncbi:DUF368 domain-containing protein [Microbacterium sp. SSW1-59]|uniref:DUF368 domain-containing protein n=1 Tax=Microbacterium xanthum TaxID=3079794 RepID=UPI002AD4BE61|nr:DUF368 domain-containing protein [Microbacterium sp. SSW1-59]MDZ8200164.1 DUF368 domain-containing protein [Microbacterium sp. SSW1-59]
MITTEDGRTTSPVRTALVAVLNVVRGGLIGLAELIPGVSGGTIALITGVYERLIDSADHVVTAFKNLIFGPERRAGFLRGIRAADWALVLPVLVGMAAMVLTLAGIVESFVTENVEASRGLFFGLVAASIFVPLQLVPRTSRSTGSRIGGVALFLAAAAVAFLAIDVAGGSFEADPPLIVVFLAAAVAVCALVVPGVSGSFFLLAIGLYTPTLRAVDERDLGYLAVFALGAVVGLVTIVRLITWLLHHHRRLTLIAMAGLMLGSLRALWPWQDPSEGEDHGIGALTAPYDPVVLPIVLAVVGAAVVLSLVAVERHFSRRAAG